MTSHATSSPADGDGASHRPTDTSAPLDLRTAGSGGDFAIDIVVHPACIPPGGTGQARVKTKPGVGLAFMVAYTDSDVAGPWTIEGTSDPAGGYAWTFVLGLDAPEGSAEVLVGATDWEAGDGATGRSPFRVARAC